MDETDRDIGMTSEDFNAFLQAAVQVAVQTAMSALAVQQGASSGGVTVGDDTPLIEGAAAVAAQGVRTGGGESMPYFVPGGGGGSDAPEYVCGDNSNIVFGDEADGKIKVDVYYV